jgi:hypothetical protein
MRQKPDVAGFSTNLLDLVMFTCHDLAMNDNSQLIGADKHERWISIVRDLVRGVRFGVVQIVIQDSKVVQVDKTEKLRLTNPES